MKEIKYMSKEYTNCLRGLFAIVVVIHHLYQNSGLFRGTYIGTLLQLSGFIAVAVFFFFSGYGLMLSSRKENYIDGFWINRFVPLYGFYVLLIFLYSVWTALLENRFSLQLFFQSFFWGGTIVTSGWYLQTTFLLYIFYVIVFKIAKTPKLQVFLFSICTMFYCVVCFLMDLGITWYQNVPCMLLGMVFCWKKNRIDILLKKYSGAIFVFCGTLFSACFLISALTDIPVLFDILYSLFFVGAVVVLAYILADTPIIQNKFNTLCGKYSLEIYVSHGFFLRLLKLNYINHTGIYICVVVVGTVLVSAVLKKMYEKIVEVLKQKNWQVCQ